MKQQPRTNRVLQAIGRQLIPNVGTLLLVALFLWAHQAGAFSRLQGTVPNVLPGIITYQGKLTDAGGHPVTGQINMTFALYDVPTGGTPLWSESYTGDNAVPVADGEFTVHLGSVNPISDTIWNHIPLYLGVTVGGDAEMTPREVVSAVPSAFASQEAIENFRVPKDLLSEGRIYLGGSETIVTGTLEHETVHSTDPTLLLGTYTGGQTSDVRLYILDDPDDRFSIWGDSCRGGNCWDLTAASEAHRFTANGTAWHKGPLVVGNGTGEGGEVILEKGESGNAWVLDNYFGVLRAHSHGQVYLSLSSGGALSLPIWGATFDTGWEGYPSITFPNTQELRLHAAGSPAASLRVDGRIFSNGMETISLTVGNISLAELASDSMASFAPGDVLCWEATAGRLEKCALPASPLVVAVADASGRPIILGITPVNVLGPVQPGDLLVASDVPGYAVAWSRVGTGSLPAGVVIAKALEGFAGERGMVKAMILAR